MSGRLAD